LRKAIDLTGQRFGRLTVLERDCLERQGKGDVRWICICDCGEYSSVVARSLVHGATKSCGCLNKEPTAKSAYRHGQNKSRLYHVWDGMKSRCYRPNARGYKNYGGRGITVCDEWRDNFVAFRDWAMANGYVENTEKRKGGCTLDRIDVNGNYEPSNCRWVNATFQANNTRRNYMITAFGQTKSLAQWARDTGISYSALTWRVKSGWPIEKALTEKYPMKARAVHRVNE
jgi:hypothetical protein